MKQKKPSITFFAAECMEFPDHWDMYDNLTLKEAVEAYKKIVKKNTSCGPGIGFVLHDPRYPDYSDIHWGLYEGRICHMQIDLIKVYKEHPLVQQAVREMEKYVPQLEKEREDRKNKQKNTWAR